MSADGFYPYGGTALGFEVGQRTAAFVGDWPVRATASLYGRDARSLTQIRQRALLVRNALGFPALPTWMVGSSRAFLRDDTDALPYPDGSVFHALRDAIFGTPAAMMLFAARYSRDSALSLSTGMAAPRFAYRLADVTAQGPLQLSDGRFLRAADSLWDFMTAFDPVSLSADDGSLILRNLDPPVLQYADSVPGLRDSPRLSFPGVTYLKDGAAAAVWNDSRSLSDDAYLPSVMSVSPVAAGLDLSCDSLWPDDVGPWASGTRVGYPVPLQPGIVYADAPTDWPQLESTGLTGPVTPNDGRHRLLLPTGPNRNGWDISAGGVPLGRAHVCDLNNGWDSAGEMIRLPRRTQEDDLTYGGRQQRLWMAGLLNSDYGRSTRGAQERTLSAGLCRSVIVPFWEGAEFSLPARATRVDALGYPDELSGAVMYLQSGDLSFTDGSYTVLRATQDMSSYARLFVKSGDQVLHRRIDFDVDPDDGTLLYIAAPVNPSAALDVIGQGRVPFRTDRQESPTTLSPERHRQAGAWQGPLLLTCGPRALTCGAVTGTILLEADRTLPSARGRGVVGRASAPTWGAVSDPNPPMAAPPFDLDQGATP